jgi:flagellar basal-body rod protein FlgB
MGVIQNLLSDPISEHLKKVMDFQVKRAEITASNLANADTPGFKALRATPNFDDILDQMGGKKDISGELRMASTNAKHMGASGEGDCEVAEIAETPGASIRVDQNTVNVDEEMQIQAKAQLEYTQAATIYRLRSGILKYMLERLT